MSLARYLSKLAALLGSDGKVPAAGIAAGAIGTDQLANSGVTAGTYGSASAIPAITVDAKGRVTSASQNAFSSAYVGAGSQIFTANGTFTVPAGITAVKVTVVGGGGSGSTANSGGGGGAAIKFLTGLTSGNTLTVTRGAAAGTSSVSSGTQSISTVSATGGGVITAGVGSGGDLNISGGAGNFTSTSSVGAPGGSSILGGGGRGNVNSSGSAGGNYGGGGAAGAYGGCASWFGGGAGAPGVIVFEW